MRPQPYQPTGRVTLIVDALAKPESSEAVQTLIGALGGRVISETERLIGEPPTRSRRLRCADGGEIILHDGAVVAVLLHFAPTDPTMRPAQLADWLPGTSNESTYTDLKQILQSPWLFSNGARCFELEGGYLRLVTRGYSQVLDRVAFDAENPKGRWWPELDDCAACSDLIVRLQAPGAGAPARENNPPTMHLERTIDALAAAIADKRLSPVESRVPLGDVLALRDSGLMSVIESQASSRSCSRVVCLTLQRDETPALRYVEHDAATWRQFEAAPPVEQWGSPERIAAEPEPMRYVDHEPGTWFLVERGGGLFLDARYSYSALIDDSALILIDENESAAYREGGHEYLTTLAHDIHNSAPYREESKYRERDLFRGEGSKEYRNLVRAAIAEHTWVAEQLRKADQVD